MVARPGTVALLVDGVRVADAESGLVEWSTIAASATTRIEAARGPGASLYGDAAIGGVIQVFTDSPSTGEVVTLSGGSLGTFTADGTWRWKTNAIGGLISGAARRTDGISDHSDASEVTFGSAINGTLRALAWRWIAGFVGRDQEDPGVLTLDQRESGVTSDPLFGADQRERRSVSTALSMRGAGTTWRHQSRLSVERRDEDGIRTILLAPGVGDTRSRDLATGGVGGSFELERSLGATPNSALRIGVEVERQHLDSRYFDVVNGEAAGGVVAQADGARVRAGAFVSSSWMPASRVRLFGAMRWDRIDDRDFEDAEAEEPTRAWSPRAGVVVQPAWLGGASLFAQVLARIQGADTRSAIRSATLSGFPWRDVHDFEPAADGAARIQHRSRRVRRQQPAAMECARRIAWPSTTRSTSTCARSLTPTSAGAGTRGSKSRCRARPRAGCGRWPRTR